MALVLGIDTGGTYTDGVIVELSTKRIICKAKALTTREDLAIGIRNCIANLHFDDFSKISFVSLSTTLATNAIVEGRGCEVGLLLIGHPPINKLPVQHYTVIPGGHNIHGKPRECLDLEKTKAVIKELEGKVDAVAISAYLSVRNPEHEVQVRDLVYEILDVPVVCAHQLTTALGFHERSVTAALNAKLIPIIEELMESVKRVLHEQKIEASIMIVKGDGCLMSDSMAREKPIDTILSGPAASIIGATYLTQTPEALVLDMGGTTTDIALLNNGVPKINSEGAMVGGWLTRVLAAEISTYGIGGDSYLQLSNENKLLVGPQRVWPLAVVAYNYPYLLDELRSVLSSKRNIAFGQLTDCYMLLQTKTSEKLTLSEKNILKAMETGPHTIFRLADILNMDANLLNLQHLVNLGIVARISFTPTDILHAKDIYSEWSNEASLLGAKILAKKLNLNLNEFIDLATETVIHNLCLTVVQSLITNEGNPLWINGNDTARYFLDRALKANSRYNLGMKLKMNLPIIGIGAPVTAWLPEVAKNLHTELLIPENAEVANAVGAATGQIMEKVKVLVKPGEGGNGYIVHAPWVRQGFLDLKTALSYALEHAKERASLAAQQAGARNYELVVNHQDVYAGSQGAKNDVYVESRIEITAVGRPEWEREKVKEKFFVDTIGC